MNNDDAVLTHETEDRGGRLCKCARCGSVERCTPRRDFYTIASHAGMVAPPLFCESCFIPAEMYARKYVAEAAGRESGT